MGRPSSEHRHFPHLRSADSPTRARGHNWRSKWPLSPSPHIAGARRLKRKDGPRLPRTKPSTKLPALVLARLIQIISRVSPKTRPTGTAPMYLCGARAYNRFIAATSLSQTKGIALPCGGKLTGIYLFWAAICPISRACEAKLLDIR